MSSMMFEEEIVTLGKDLVADTTSDTTTAVVDMQGYDEVEFRVWHGDIDAAAVMVYTLKENSANSTSSPTPTTVPLLGVIGTGASLSSGTGTITESSGNLDDKCIRINVARHALSKRYCFLVISCTIESYEIDKIEVVRRRKSSLPITDSSDVAATFYAGT